MRKASRPIQADSDELAADLAKLNLLSARYEKDKAAIIRRHQGKRARAKAWAGAAIGATE
jgi:hypothetical protein